MEQARSGTEDVLRSDSDCDNESFASSTDESCDESVQPQIAASENKAVGKSRLLLVVVLLLSASLTGWSVYRYTNEKEHTFFKETFRATASELITVIQENAKSAEAALNQFSVAATSSVLERNDTFPLATIPDFSRRIAALLLYFYAIHLGLGHCFYSIRPIGRGHRLLRFADKPVWGEAPWLPFWQNYPVTSADLLNQDWGDTFNVNADFVKFLDQQKSPVALGVGFPSAKSYFLSPIQSSFSAETSNTGGILVGSVRWGTFLSNLIPEEAGSIQAVVSNTCNQTFSFLLTGVEAVLLLDDENNTIGSFDDDTYAYLEEHFPLNIFGHDQVGIYNLTCKYYISIRPTNEFHEQFLSDAPLVYTGLTVLVFAVTSMVFYLYDWLVQRRQNKVLDSAERTGAIVSSLFPSGVRDQLIENALVHGRARRRANRPSIALGSHLGGKAIANLYLNTTVFFADIQGFTAWSSMREASQVFTLLEMLYHEFDKVASRMGVFKIETVGDSYLAVCGLPRERKDHAVVMAKFAIRCNIAAQKILRKLEVVLGPGTASLGIRYGLHSGQTTGGVLRGEKARFQLFGDTVNTGSRIEEAGEPNRVHLSETTAKELIESGRESWLTPRKDVVNLKGKGIMKTYWLVLEGYTDESKSFNDSSCTSFQDLVPFELCAEAESRAPFLSPEKQSLVNWNATLLLHLLKQVASVRPDPIIRALEHGKYSRRSVVTGVPSKNTDSNMVLDEVKDVIELPSTQRQSCDPNDIVLPVEITNQMTDYVACIAASYNDNPFHNFFHASQVCMSVHKLLSRIVAPPAESISSNPDQQIANQSFGITSDPLIHLAIVMSALIHDVDHRGVSNARLAEEDITLAKKYQHKSVAEQRSVDLGWEILMEDRFRELRCWIMATPAEATRFRQIIVNNVLATDIFDKDLSKLRRDRWEKAFSDEVEKEELSRQINLNRKATIVIEHIIQASDVAHTMQHWHIYQEWNERLFHEMYLAYVSGRQAKNPADGWYKGELWFFDNYIIPLAKKLENCGVFGVSSDEFLNYATANRQEWEAKGEEIVAEFSRKYKPIEKAAQTGLLPELEMRLEL